jgi:hypothetical protein
MGEKKPFDRLQPERCLGLIADVMNALEKREREGALGPDLWREIRSIVSGLVPAVYWRRPAQRRPTLLTGEITMPDPQWAVAGLNRLMRKSGVLPAAQLNARGKPEMLVYQPSERARLAWALWWCFERDELKRLRRCEACGHWFRDATKPLNQRRCSTRCSKRMSMRNYRAKLRRRKSGRRQTKKKEG